MTQVGAAEQTPPTQKPPEFLELSWLCEEMLTPTKNSSKLQLDNFLWRKTRFYDILKQLEYHQKENTLKTFQVRNKPFGEYVGLCQTKINKYHQSLMPNPNLYFKSLNDELSSLCHRINSLHVLGYANDELVNLKQSYKKTLKEMKQAYMTHGITAMNTHTGCELTHNITQSSQDFMPINSRANQIESPKVGILDLLRQVNRGLIDHRHGLGKTYRLAEDEFFMLTNILDDMLIYVFLDTNQIFWTIAVKKKEAMRYKQGSILPHSKLYIFDKIINYQYNKIVLFNQEAQ